MPNPVRWVWNQAKRIFRREDGAKSTEGDRATQRDEFVNARNGPTDDLARDVAQGKITVQQWELAMREHIKDTFIAEYMAARGGKEAMTQRDYGVLGSELKKQYEYLHGFAGDVAAGKLSAAQIQLRARLYNQAARQAFERARTEARKMPRLPAYPGDGSTVCRTNCRCAWDIQDTETGWDCYWKLGRAEHCPDCVDRAGRWNPLTMMAAHNG